MAAIIHPLLTLLASCSQQELARQNRYLKAENQILRSKLPGRITLSNQDRRILVRHGKKLGPRIRDLISIVIHLGSRQIWVSPCTASPSGDWTAQQARNFSMHLQDQEGLECKILCRDNDSKYTEAFDGVFKSEGCQIKRTTPMSPNLQAHIERVIQTLKHEVLNGFCIVTNQHLDNILRTAVDWYNRRRGHSARDHLPPVRDDGEPPLVDLAKRKLVCHAELGGHLKSYRAAA